METQDPRLWPRPAAESEPTSHPADPSWSVCAPVRKAFWSLPCLPRGGERFPGSPPPGPRPPASRPSLIDTFSAVTPAPCTLVLPLTGGDWEPHKGRPAGGQAQYSPVVVEERAWAPAGGQPSTLAPTSLCIVKVTATRAGRDLEGSPVHVPAPPAATKASGRQSLAVRSVAGGGPWSALSPRCPRLQDEWGSHRAELGAPSSCCQMSGQKCLRLFLGNRSPERTHLPRTTQQVKGGTGPTQPL